MKGFARRPEGLIIRGLSRGDAGRQGDENGRFVLLSWSHHCPVCLVKASLPPFCVAALSQVQREEAGPPELLFPT